MGRTSELQLKVFHGSLRYSSNSDLISFQVTNKAIYYSFLNNRLYAFIPKDYLGILLLPQSYPKTKYLQSQNDFSWTAGLDYL